MSKKIIIILAGFSILSSCGDSPIIRAATGAVVGGAIAYGLDGDVLTGVAAGAGIGYLTDRSQVDFGESPIY